ncbi:MAG: HEAT repeat domain-containing protein [Abitibacteriaceae bacterium]|nr:HEAT repeat domain-containing protein [Abditibacteriaceae bacterium]
MEKAYIHALSDKNEKVVSIACGELGSQPSKDAVTALFTMLSHPSWRIRLEVCKSLIKLKAADGRVVSTLEKMTQEPEAIKYDAETEEFHQHAEEIHRQYPNEPKLEMWGKIGEILAQAQQIAAQQS